MLAAFDIPLKDFNERFNSAGISARIIARLKRIERKQSTNELYIQYLRAVFPIIRVNVHRIKEIVMIVNALENGKKLMGIVRGLF